MSWCGVHRSGESNGVTRETWLLFGVRTEHRRGSLYKQDAAGAVAAKSCPINLIKAVCL